MNWFYVALCSLSSHVFSMYITWNIYGYKCVKLWFTDRDSNLYVHKDVIWVSQQLNAAEMMRDDGADINSSNLLIRWSVIWISALPCVKAKGVCPCAFIVRISGVICQHDWYSFGNLRAPACMDWLIIDPCSNSLSRCHSCLWMPNESFCLVLSQPSNPINEWEWVSSSADVNLSLRHLSQIVYWWGPRSGRGQGPRPDAFVCRRKVSSPWKTQLLH